MKFFREINEITEINLKSAKIMIENLTNYFDDEIDIIMESAEEFLGSLATSIRFGAKKFTDEDNNEFKNNMSMLAALDILRHGSARKDIDVNTINGYLNIIKNVTKTLTLSPLDVNIIHELGNLHDEDTGTSGLELRDHYIELYHRDPEQLVREINIIKTNYQRIGAHLQHLTATKEPAGEQPNKGVPHVGTTPVQNPGGPGGNYPGR